MVPSALLRRGVRAEHLLGVCGRVHTHRPGCGHDPPRHHNVRSAPDPAAVVIITTGRRTAARVLYDDRLRELRSVAMRSQIRQGRGYLRVAAISRMQGRRRIGEQVIRCISPTRATAPEGRPPRHCLQPGRAGHRRPGHLAAGERGSPR